MLSSFRLLSQHSSATRSSTIQNGDTDSDKPEVRQTARYLTFRRQRLHGQHSSATRSSTQSKLTADTSAILDSFDSLSNTLQKLNRRIHASTRTIGSPGSPRHKSRAQLLHSFIHCRLHGAHVNIRGTPPPWSHTRRIDIGLCHSSWLGASSGGMGDFSEAISATS